MCGVTMLLVEHKVWSKTKVIQDDSMQNERTVLVIQCNCWVENESMYIVLTTATLELVDCPSVPLFRLLNRWRASCASAVFAKLVPPRSSEDSKSNTVNGCAESTNEQVIKRREIPRIRSLILQQEQSFWRICSPEMPETSGIPPASMDSHTLHSWH